MQATAAFALLLCNGEMAASDVVRHLASLAHTVVCADGGANVALALGLRPDIIVGDFDSISSEAEEAFAAQGVDMRRMARQDDTDFEKALTLLRERGTRRVVVLGVTGKLLDHTLGNISILHRYLSSMRIVLFDPHFRVDVLQQGGSFRSRPGDRISIVPLPVAERVSYSGLRYPLDAATLTFGAREGTCNEASGDAFSIDFSAGSLLLFRQLHDDLYLHPFGD
ncbi:MAG: thiamine diphosphokinase [Bacteroidota bacterium]|nr:thiamine diphosphokinase [Bacteroidota bacterium]